MLSSFLHEFQETVQVQEFSGLEGLLQAIDPRVKLVCFIALVVSAVAVRNIASVLILSLLVVALCMLSRIPIRFFLLRATIFIPVFAGVIALPLLFITPGIPVVGFSSGLLALTVTPEGAYKAAVFTFRVWVCVAASVLLISTTKFNELIHGMEKLRFPETLVTMMSVTYRYVFLFINEAYRMVLAMESRTVKQRRWRDTLRSLASIMATLFIRSYERGERVYFAMTARGYTGSIRYPNEMRLARRDLFFAVVFLLMCLTVVSADFSHFGGG